MFGNKLLPLLAIMYLMGVVGCATWYKDLHDSGPNVAKKQVVKPPEGHVSLQTIFLRLEDKDRGQLDDLWPQLDELSFDFNLRRELDENGIRCGAVNGDMPIALQNWIDRVETKLADDLFESVGVAADVQSYSQVIVCKSGSDRDIMVKPMRSGKLVVMHHDGGGHGKTFDDPALLFKLRGTLAPSGGIGLEVEPVIEHGQFKNMVMGQDVALRRELKRDRQFWPKLKVQRELRPGQTLVLSATATPRALGEHFFTTKLADGSTSQLVLLVRIDKNDRDQAFSAK